MTVGIYYMTEEEKIRICKNIKNSVKNITKEESLKTLINAGLIESLENPKPKYPYN